MHLAIVMQGQPLGIQEALTACPECGGIAQMRIYESQPFTNVPSITSEVIEVICETCDIHLVMVDVNHEPNTDEKPPSGFMPNQPRDKGYLN